MDNKNLWWEPAIEIFTKISAWIVTPIILALFVGRWFDTHFGTRPWIFIGFAVVGFLISSFGMVKTILEYNRKVEKETKKESHEQSDNK